ncbi:SxtJ family membrane protein [Synechococcus sp. NB0720_010]|uniref:SxtJ family membrane protein n=1 Tax=Synechococcus sp. NB0720_010 TaxID=2907159 RepID=UPI001FFB41AE|nr:SxtJ family membrane protein [Synechococcus sp. NB0720_010]UPH89193.1 SxtJ family membrane protein [Synechococcus sp. NB0720_010]
MAHSSFSSVSKKQLREFGILLGIVFPVVFGWLIPGLKGHHAPIWPFLIGIPSLALGLIKPGWLQWPYQGWMKLGHILGWINGHLILGAVFVFVLQPIAYLMRLTGYDPLKRKRTGLQSYREQPKHKLVDLTRIF